MILVAQDVREHGVLVFAGVLDESHSDAADGSRNGYAGIHECQTACTGAGHRAGTVALQDVAHYADGVGEVLGKLTLQAAPSQMAVTDLATSYASLCLRLAGGEGREVVVEQEALVFTYEHIVDELLVELCAERTGSERLCLAAGEDGASVRSGQRTYLAPDGTNIGGLTTVEADAFVQNAAAHGVLLYVVVVAVNECVLLLEFFGSHISVCLGVSCFEVLANGFESLCTSVLLEALLRDVVGFLVASLLDSFTQLVVVHLVAVLALHVLAKFLLQFLLEAAHGLDGLVGSLEGSQKVGLLHFLHFAFHHHDVLFGSAYHEVHVGLSELLEGGVDDKLSVDTGYAHLRNGTFEGNVAASQSCRSGKASQSIGHVHAIGREEDYIHIHFSMIVAGEKGTQGAVHQATSENLVVVCLTLTLRETAGKTSGSKILFSVLYL